MKGRLHKFESNSTATSDGGAQKLEKDVKCNPESIATNVCSPLSPISQMKCYLSEERASDGLLRFESNSTETSDGDAQMLGNNLWHDSASIAAKVCCQIG